MTRPVAALSLVCLLTMGGFARPADRATETDKGAAYLGVLFGPVSDALYDQLPQLPHSQGVLVTQVLADSPAEKAGLRRNDILLLYNDKKIRGCEDLVRFLQADAPDHGVKLALLRGGKETTAEATLALGPAIRTAQEVKAGNAASDIAPGVAKPGGPAAVSVAATPLERGRMKVTVEFYPDGQSRLQRITCEGDSDEIDSVIAEKVPERERGMVRVALKRIRSLNAPKDAEKPPEAP
jgi:membrane-associated protease RseP (regulator of RpoE activity)